MPTSLALIEAIHDQQNSMLQLLERWVNINSWTDNPQGLAHMLKELEQAFLPLGGEIKRMTLPSHLSINAKGQITEKPTGQALSIKKHPEAPLQILLGGHMDTVYPPTSHFQKAEKLEATILRGPGVTDMKGGLVIMLKALETFEQSPYAGKIGWEVLINADEEIGSPVSTDLFKERASKFHLGLIFEPAFPDGSLVSERRGSMNYTFIAHGKSAHVGRDFESGRNAIVGMARLVQQLETLNNRQRGIQVNVGSFEGGGPTNIVPDLAVCKMNVRVQNPADQPIVAKQIQNILQETTSSRDLTFELHTDSMRPPKPFNKAHHRLFEALRESAKRMNIDLKWQPTGGVCDGNTLSAEGLPTIDTLGAVGGHLHTHDEYLYIPSLVQRTQLVTYFLIQLAEKQILAGEIL
ncbi:MAG: hypothetical protein BGO14_06955 [Chlamydiales bacterium 38-26]|nr:hydrolase [Chlamydiales bacterium]OJV08612.1 MAG: hypothetical protein BGO14_06955 [Chlamydiales bacterium 38-26]